VHKKVSSTRFLGVNLEENLSWKEHMKNLLKQIQVQSTLDLTALDLTDFGFNEH